MTSVEGKRGCYKMPCESCAVQFSVFKRKRACSECERYYCSACLRRGGGICAPCRTLSTRPLARQNIAHLKVRDLQCFLQSQNVSTRGCVEKDELVSLCVLHVNSERYRRRSPRNTNTNDSPFGSLKGFTNNINEFITSAFDHTINRPQTQPTTNQQQQQGEHRNNCYNSSHAHASPERDRPAPAPAPPYTAPHYREKFNPRPRGEPDIEVEVPPPAVSDLSHSSSEGARLDTADCFEVEDLDDGSWELVNKPAEPLPNDSEVLLDIPSPRVEPDMERMDMSATLAPPTPQRATSALDLRSDPIRDSRSPSPNTDTASLRDEPLMSTQITENASPQLSSRLTLGDIKHESDLEALTAKQLKELLARNRVEFKGCIERPELLNRARMLWKEHVKYKDEIDRLPIEECCKICMAAPLECVLLECGHIAACTDCAKQLAECPICRQYVVRAVRFFRS